MSSGAGLVMSEEDQDPLALLSRLIDDAGAHRVDQMLRIADLLADDQPIDEAEQALHRIEQLLASMRARRSLLLSNTQPAHS